MATFRTFKAALYRLLKRRGVSVTITVPGTRTPNYAAGTVEQSDTEYTIARAAMLTKRSLRIVAPTVGAGFPGNLFVEVATRTMIIETRNLPSGYTPSKKDIVTYDGANWEVLAIDELPGTVGYVMPLKKHEAQ